MRKLFLILMTLVACTWSLSAQTRSYHGTVVDGANNEPLIGATIMPIGGGQGVATDTDGKFSLNVPANVRQVKVSYVGYTTQTVTLQNNMVVHLHSTSSNLDDVVVVAYGTANKESLTGSVAVVGSKEIEDRPVTSVTAALEGNAPGVMINNSTTQPGEAPTIRVRGFSSINGSNEALVILDGTEYVGDISALNPQDIESMSVLKDAASCALYGNRGANGVVLITTKKAKNVGKVDVTLQTRQGFYNRALPMYDRLDANDWMEATFRANVNGTYTAQQAAGMTYDQAVEYWRNNYITDFAKLNIYDAAAKDLFDANGKLVAPMLAGYANSDDRDWWKSVSRTGYRQEYNVNIAGATEKFNVFASAGYLKEEGYVLQTDFERFNGRVNINANPVSFLRLGLNLNAQHSESQRSPLDSSELGYTNNPFSVTMHNAPIYPYYVHDAAGNIVYNEDGTPMWNQNGDYLGNGNICYAIREDRRNFSVTAVDASLFGTAILPYGFEFTLKGSMFRDKTTEMEYNNIYEGSQKNIGSITDVFYETKTHMFQQMLTWNHDYGMHHVDVLLDHENYQYGYGYRYLRKSGQQLLDNITLGNFEEMKDMNEYQILRKTESYLGRVRYNYAQKYFAEASIRRDGSSRFHKDDRWGTFWSVGASWIISKEKFMHSLNWINFLKLRAAYGSVGNDASAASYAHYALYGFGWAIGGNTSNLVPSQLAPDHLKWETTKTLDVALEGSLFNDRFNFSIGYYNKQNTDLLFQITAPWSAGGLGNTGSLPTVWSNIGTMENQGWELQFGVDIIRNKDFKWNFNIDASFLKNKIKKLYKNQDIPGQALFQGKSLYEQYTYEWAGVDRLTGQSLYAMNPDSPDYYEYDENNNLVYDEAAYLANEQAAEKAGALVEINGVKYTTNRNYAARKIMGTSLPTVFGSFGTSLSWKGVNLGILFTYSLGGKRYDGNYASLMTQSATVASAYHKDQLNAWTQAPEGMTENSADRIDPNGVPQLNTTNSAYNNAASSRWLISNNYITLKNINLSYDLPKAWVEAMKMQNLNLGFSVDNVFISSRRKGMNPQYNFGGGQGFYFVPARTFTFQLTVKF